MHVWVVEARVDKYTDWYPIGMNSSRADARFYAKRFSVNNGYCKTRVVKYISTKGE